MMKRGLLTLTTATILGCAASRHTPSEPVRTLPPVHVVAFGEHPSDVAVDAYDAKELFRRGAAAQQTGDCAEAVRWYERLEKEFPTTAELEPGYYNKGLCLDEMGKSRAAAASYQLLLHLFPNSPDRKNAYFRLAASLEELAEWTQMIRTLDELKETTNGLYALDEVEIFAKKGAALIEMNQPEQARIALETAIRIYTLDERISDTAPDYYYSMAQFKLAEIIHSEMRGVALPADDAELAAILEKKCQLLLDSQFLYTKVIRIGHPHWSAAAAYRTGALYHHLWEDLLATDAPAGLTAEEQGIYMEVLRKRIRILLQKAVKQWKRTLQFAERLQLNNIWVAQTESDLREIESTLQIEETIGDDLPVGETDPAPR